MIKKLDEMPADKTQTAESVVKVAVIGTGVMGQNHLRVYDGLKGVKLVGLYDSDHMKASVLADQYNCTALSLLEDVVDAVDAISICTPSVTHHEFGKFFLNRKVHCLIEKPLAASQSECQDLIGCAKRANVKLLVGHIERFNPAVQQVFSLLKQGAKIQAIEARRLSSVSARIKDVDVIMDLMVHDLDIVLALARSGVERVYATEARTDVTAGGDYVTGLLEFKSGVTATVVASRMSQNPVRKLTVTTDRGAVEVDYQNQSADIYLKTSTIDRGSNSPFGQYASGISMESVQIRRQEPLQLELSHFVDIINSDQKPFVSGQQALDALMVVWEIQDIVKRGR